MYDQINPTEMFREHHLALLEEAEERRLARRLRAGRETKARSRTAASGLLAALVVAGLMLVALSSPAYASTTFTVNSTANTGDPTPDGTCDTCTLREAIQEANSNSNPTETDTINFNISGDGVHTISPNPALPIITEPVIINGYSQPGSSPNTIAFNGTISGDDGVAVFGDDTSTGNRILSNSIFSNVGLGIDLIGPDEDGATNVSNANDPKDPDTGPNNLQNKPVLTSAKTSGTKLTIVGNLNSTPNRTFTVQFFSNPSGGDEGKTFRAQRSVTTNDNGNAPFSFGFDVGVPAGQSMTATATGAGDTSEFSAPPAVVAQ